MNSFILNITASSGEFYQGSCESMVLPVKDGVYGVQAGHSSSSPWTARPGKFWSVTASPR